jgi:hypothetical protein
MPNDWKPGLSSLRFPGHVALSDSKVVCELCGAQRDLLPLSVAKDVRRFAAVHALCQGKDRAP